MSISSLMRDLATNYRGQEAHQASKDAWDAENGEELRRLRAVALAASKAAANARSMISMKSNAEIARLRAAADTARKTADAFESGRPGRPSALNEESARIWGALTEALGAAWGCEPYQAGRRETATENGAPEAVCDAFTFCTAEGWDAAADAWEAMTPPPSTHPAVEAALEALDPSEAKVVFLASADPAALAATAPAVTVEAEFGDAVVEGSVLTMAHHGPRAGGKCPGAYTSDDVSKALSAADAFHAGESLRGDYELQLRAPLIVGLSHFDLDTIGGCMAVLEVFGECFKGGRSPLGAAFWRLAEHVDVNGPHRLTEAPDAENAEAVECLRAFWAWGSANRGPRVTNEVVDLTTHVKAAAEVVMTLLAGHTPYDSPDNHRRTALLTAGREFAAAEETLRAASFRAEEQGVALRSAPGFTNHLYSAHPRAAVVAFNETTQAVTVSFADGGVSESAVAVVQALWGSLAGGHRGIAGSPRGQAMTFEDAETAFRAVVAGRK